MKPFKTVCTICLASVMLLSSVPLGFAQEAQSASSEVTAVQTKGEPATPNVSLQAEAKITKEQAIQLAQKAIAIPDGFVLQSVSLNSNSYPSNGPVWGLSYVKKVKDQYIGNLNITIDAVSGKLIGFNSYNNDPNVKPSYPPKVDFQQAKEIAAQWIAANNAEAQSETRYNEQNEKSFRPPLNGNVFYEIRYDRVVNGIPYPQNYISVTVNGEGEVTGYNCAWETKLTFDDPAGVMNAEDGAKAFRDKANIALSYYLPYQAKEKKMFITYGMDLFPLDAKTGDIWMPRGVKPDLTPNTQPLTDKPLADPPSDNRSLSKEEAVQVVQSAVKLPEGAKLVDASFNENTDHDSGKTISTWNLRWSPTAPEGDSIDPKINGDIWAAVNSKTGELMSYNDNPMIYSSDASKEQPAIKLTAEAAKSVAVDFVKKTLPAYTHQLVLQNLAPESITPAIVKPNRGYSFHFWRSLEGVKAGYDSVYVTVDAVSGEISSYSMNFSNFDYPKQKPDVISLDKAKDLLLSQFDIQLVYTHDWYSPPNVPFMSMGDSYTAAKLKLMAAAGDLPQSNNDNKSLAKLVYQLVPKNPSNTSYFLDAATGEWRSQESGSVISLEKLHATDIEGHWAQKELQLMLDYQALDVKDGKVNPDQSITRGELIKMLVISINGGNYGIKYSAERSASFADVKQESPYFAYVERAVDLRILDRTSGDFNPEAKMTREDMAELIVRSLGYGKLAEHSSMFSKDFADAAEVKRVGDAALVTGLGIMTLEDGRFLPTEEVTKSQAATAFYRYLQARAELQDQRIY